MFVKTSKNMQKQIWVFLCISILALGCNSNSSTDNLKFKALTSKSYNINEPLLSFKESSYTASLVDGKLQENKYEYSKRMVYNRFFNKNNILEKTDFYVKNKLQTSTLCKFDKLNNYISFDSYGKNNKLVHVDNVIESTENSMVKERNHFLHTSPSILVKETYKNELLSIKTSVVGDSIFTKRELYRNTIGDVVKTIIINEVNARIDTTIYTTKYLSFDKHNNWIKCITSDKKNSENAYVTERAIEYRKK